MATIPKIVYNFNENSTATIRDYSENGNDGTTEFLTVDASARVGYDATFYSPKSRILLGAINDLNNVAACAFHLGIQIDASTGTKKILTRNWQFDLEYDYSTNIMTFSLNVASGVASVSTAALSIGTFYDFDFVYESDVLTLYQDNVSVDTDSAQSGNVDTADTDVYLGSSVAASSDSALFLLNEFKLYDVAITDAIRNAVIDEQNGILCDDGVRDVFALGDVLFANLNTNPVYAVVTWVGTGTDFRFIPLTSGILNGDEFKRGANLWDTTRQWGLKIDDTPQVCFYDGQSKSSEIFAASKKTVCMTKEGIIKNSSTKTANFTVTSADHRIYVDSSGGAFTITLEASPTTDRELEIIDSTGNCNANTVTIDGNGNNIIGNTTYSMNTSFEALKLIYNGTNWNLN